MKRRDRAEMVVAWLESEGEAGREVTRETVELAVRRNAMTDAEARELHLEVLRVLRSRGYDVEAPIDLAAWAWLGVASLVVWAAIILLVAVAAGAI